METIQSFHIRELCFAGCNDCFGGGANGGRVAIHAFLRVRGWRRAYAESIDNRLLVLVDYVHWPFAYDDFETLNGCLSCLLARFRELRREYGRFSIYMRRLGINRLITTFWTTSLHTFWNTDPFVL